MNGFVIYLIGWLLMSIGYYVYKVYVYKDIWINKRLIVYRAFWFGIGSWLGIMWFTCMGIVYALFSLNDYIENKLS